MNGAWYLDSCAGEKTTHLRQKYSFLGLSVKLIYRVYIHVHCTSSVFQLTPLLLVTFFIKLMLYLSPIETKNIHTGTHSSITIDQYIGLHTPYNSIAALMTIYM